MFHKVLNTWHFQGLPREEVLKLFDQMEEKKVGTIKKTLSIKNLNENGDFDIVETVDKDWEKGTPYFMSEARWYDMGYSVEEDPESTTDYVIDTIFVLNGTDLEFQKPV